MIDITLNEAAKMEVFQLRHITRWWVIQRNKQNLN